MIFNETKLAGAFTVALQRIEDERGYFARSWCHDEFLAAGLNVNLVQSNVSFNHRKGTLRGMHYQTAPHAETKLVRCTRGAIFDVIVDLREDSSTYGEWLGVELTAANAQMLYVPEGFAHGFETLDDATEVAYHVTEFYTPGAERGLRHDDPALGIAWPLPVAVVSPKDVSWPLLEPASLAGRAR